MAHEDDEALSALIDGELAAEDALRVGAHLTSCAECSRRSEKLRSAAAAFRRSGEAPMPPDLAARVSGKESKKISRRTVLELALAATGALGAVLISGVALKKFMPTLFNNIQQMITGAASQMGSGGK